MNHRIDSIVIEYRPDAAAALETDVMTAFGGGAGRVVLNLDALETLDTENVRTLIALLRRTRSTGGELALQASKPHVLRTLSVTALDRIFTMVAGAAA